VVICWILCVGLFRRQKGTSWCRGFGLGRASSASLRKAMESLAFFFEWLITGGPARGVGVVMWICSFGESQRILAFA
jgi:hypothetical protein